jgi:hypothetical protein
MGQQKIIGLIIVLLALAGGGYLVVRHSFLGGGSSSSLTIVHPSLPAQSVPTPAWYEAHQDILQADNQRCAQEGSNMPPGLCANVAIADQVVSNQNALNALNQASGKSGK